MTLVSMSLYSYINTCDVVRTVEKVQKDSPPARDFELFLVLSQHPACLYKSTKTWKNVLYCLIKGQLPDDKTVFLTLSIRSVT